MTLLEKISALVHEAAIEPPVAQEIYAMRFSNGITVQYRVTIYDQLSDTRLLVEPDHRRNEIPPAELDPWFAACNEDAKSLVPFQIEGGLTLSDGVRSVMLSAQLARSAGLR